MIKNIYKQYRFYTCASIYLTVMILISVYQSNALAFNSTFVGLIFSFIILKNLTQTQASILRLKKHQHYFIPFFLRLSLFAIPVILSQVYKDSFNLFLILISLLFFQGQFVLIVFLRSLKKLEGKNNG